MWWSAHSFFWMFVPAPIFSVEPISIRTLPSFTSSKSFTFSLSFFASWMNFISSSGIPRAISLLLISSYRLKPFDGVERSRKTTCVRLSSFVSSHLLKMLFTAILTLLSGLSSTVGSTSRISNAHIFPSLVIFSILSLLGSTRFWWTSSALSPQSKINSFCSSDGLVRHIVYLPFFSFGTGNFNVSAVWISATLR